MTPVELAHALQDADPEHRRQALLRIEPNPEPATGPLLMRALGDEDWRVRREAVTLAQAHLSRLQLLEGLIDAVCQGENVGLRNAALAVFVGLGDDPVPALLHALRVRAANCTRFLLEALVACGNTEPVQQAVVELAGHPDPNVASAALDALARLGGERALHVLRHTLSSTEPYLRLAALDALNRLHARLTWHELEALLADPVVRRVALVALGRCADVRALEPLLNALDEPSSHVVSVAAEALHTLAADNAAIETALAERMDTSSRSKLPRLRPLPRADAEATRQAGGYLLCLARDTDSLAAVVELATTAALVPSTLRALRSWGSPAAEAMIELSRERTGEVRATALELGCDLAAAVRSQHPEEGLTELGKHVGAALRDALAAPSEAVHQAALRCLETWSAEIDPATLVRHTSGASLQFGRLSARVLSQQVQSKPDAVERALTGVSLDEPGRAELAQVVALLGGEEALARLEEALSSISPETRRAAIDALATLKDPKVAALIEFALADESPAVRSAAAQALGSLRDPEGKPMGVGPLLLAVRSEDDRVRMAAAHALGRTGDTRAVAALRELARSEQPALVFSAIAGLRALGHASAHDTLVETLGHTDEEIVKQALRALAEAGGSQAVPRVAIGLEHPVWHVRQLAAELLEGLGDRRCLPELEACLAREEDDLVRDALQKAMGRLQGSR